MSSLQPISVTFTINGTSEEVYNCTLNNKVFSITVGQPPIPQTGLTPNTPYTINCQSMTNSCLEAKAGFTTGKYRYVALQYNDGSVAVNIVLKIVHICHYTMQYQPQKLSEM